MQRHFRLLVVGTLALSAAAAVALSVRSQPGQQTLQQGFEGRDPIWLPGPFDVAYKETAHKLTDETAHTGQKSELIQLQVEKPGSYIYYTYPIGKAPIVDELNVSVWVKANRPGMRLLCRVVLPRERDPQKPDQPLTTMLEGETYNLSGRWQQLVVRQPVKQLREKQPILNGILKHAVLTDDAYVDRVFLNVYGGPGETIVHTDDLEVGPLLDGPTRGPDTTTPGRVPAFPAVNRRTNEVTEKDGKLLVNGDRLFMRGIRHTGTPLKALRKTGFNVVFLDETTPPALIEDAANLGFWLIPMLSPPTVAEPRGGAVSGQLTSASSEAFNRKMAPFQNSGAVLSWYVAQNVQSENYSLVSLTEKPYRSFDPQRPLAIDVMNGLNNFAHDPNPLMLGMHRWPLMTGLELTGYRDWLTQRRRLLERGAPDSYCWTWIQTHLDDWYTKLIYDRPGANGFDEPVGPQPEQIRLMTYIAVGCGYRGVAFWSDRFLADSHAGRDRLLEMALLNQELQLLEPLLVASATPTWIDTSHPEVKAAVFRTDDRKAILVLPVWLGAGSQCVVGQAALSQLKITVPQVMGSAQAWEVSPAKVQALPTERVVGGTSVTLHEFGLTGAVVFTSDLSSTGLVVHFQNRQRSIAPQAAQWAHEQALEELAKVEKVEAELDKMGAKLVDSDQLLAKSRSLIDACAKARRNGNYSEAYADAQRALRPLRILMRAHWDRAIRELGTYPQASPFAVSFYTLPRFWKFAQNLKKVKPAANVLTGGDFELPMDRQPEGWLLDNPTPLDEVVTKAQRVTTEAYVGKQSLMLEMLPKNSLLPPLALERSYVAITSPSVRLLPGTLVQILACVKIPQKIASSVDGLLVFDSVGGEPLGVRITDKTPWRWITLYRRVPASGTINVTMALTGIGRVYIDEVKIQPLVVPAAPPKGTTTSAKAAVTPR